MERGLWEISSNSSLSGFDERKWYGKEKNESGLPASLYIADVDDLMPFSSISIDQQPDQ